MKLVEMERHTLYTALGIRFWDAVMMRPATDLHGLAQLVNNANALVGKQVVSKRNQRGVEVFFGLHPDERTNDAEKEGDLPTYKAVITVKDPQRRYIPVAFIVQIPHQKIFYGQPSLLPADLQAKVGVYLFSSPSRPTPEGMAMIQGQIVVGNKTKEPEPAKHALLKVISEELRRAEPGNGQGRGNNRANLERVQVIYYGMTDSRGVVKLPIPYPALPESAPKVALRKQTFNLTLQVLYEPTAQAQNPLPDSIELPNFASIIQQQPARIASAFQPDPNDPDAPGTLIFPANADPTQFNIQLTYDVPSILRTPLATTGDGDSYFRILPPA